MKNKSKFNFTTVHKVTWGEMDALGHVNNATYFTYFENARIDYFRSLGFKTVTARDKVGPILAHISCDFIKPVTFPDTLTIGVGIARIGRSSLHVEHDVYSKKEDDIVAVSTSVVVMVDYDKSESVPVSDEIRASLGF